MSNSKLDFPQIIKTVYDKDLDALKMTPAGGTLVPENYDKIELAYTGSNLTTVTYKLSGATVATLTLGYDGADNLISVDRS